jgi:preprotein translocase subunit YajC
MAGQPGAGGQQGGGGIMGMLLPMLLVFGIFYFMMIRPQQKQAKKQRAMIEALKRGDEVVTRSGIHARIHGIADNILTLEIAENVKIKMNKDQVAYVKQPMAAATE